MTNGKSGDGAGEHLAQWLKEAGYRTRSAAATTAAGSDETYNSPASLHLYLEELAGKPLRTHTELLAFLHEVAGDQPRNHHVTERRRMVRELSLMVLLALSYLHFYYWEVQLQIAALSSVRTFTAAPPQKKT